MTVILNGNSYANADFLGTGYNSKFPEPIFTDMLAQLATDKGIIDADKDAAAASATLSANSASAAAASVGSASGLQGISATSLTVGSGTKNPNIGTGKAWVPGMLIKIARTSAPATTWMLGTVVTYDTGTGAASIVVGSVADTDFSGSGTHTDWTISFPGARGIAGTGALTRDSVLKTSGFTVSPGYHYVVDCRSSPVTGTLHGSDWNSAEDWCEIQVVGTNLFTLAQGTAPTKINNAAVDDTNEGAPGLIRVTYIDATFGVMTQQMLAP